MTRIIVLMVSVMILSACTVTPPPSGKVAKQRAYCRTHAREFVGEADEQGKYRGCILLQGRHDVDVTTGE